MNGNWKVGLSLLGIVLVVVVVLMLQPAPSVGAAMQKAPDVGAHYTVVATDGTHLIVTDNKANKVYFYAIEQGGKPGDELKFRGTINLEDVGKPTIQPTKAK
jgi:hypothetical protein